MHRMNAFYYEYVLTLSRTYPKPNLIMPHRFSSYHTLHVSYFKPSTPCVAGLGISIALPISNSTAFASSTLLNLLTCLSRFHSFSSNINVPAALLPASSSGGVVNSSPASVLIFHCLLHHKQTMIKYSVVAITTTPQPTPMPIQDSVERVCSDMPFEEGWADDAVES